MEIKLENMNSISKYFIFFIIFTFPALCAYTQETVLEKKAYLQKIAVCRCIYYGFKNEHLDLEEKDNSTWGALDLTSAQDKDLKKIDQLAKRFAYSIKPIEYSQDVSHKPIIIECLRFYQSDSLKILLMKIKLTRD